MDVAVINQIYQIMPEKYVHQNESMSSHTSFQIGGPAEIYCEPARDELIALVAFCRQSAIPMTLIGNGSNLLVSDAGIKGVVIACQKRMNAISITNESITAEAGALLGIVARQAADASLSGMEFAAGIPGSIGGAVIMNAGAYGEEMKDIIVSALVLDKDQVLRSYSRDELELEYRTSKVMRQKGIVIEASLQLKEGNKNEIHLYMKELAQKRMDKQPLSYPSAGSTFKRPEGHFAGQLIQEAGLLGFSIGGAEVSTKHGGFVINARQATAEDVFQLMKEVQRRVYEKSGVKLEPEVRLVGEWREQL